MSPFTPYLPWISLFVGLLAVFATPRTERSVRLPWRWLALGAVVLAASIALGISNPAKFDGAYLVLAGFGIGLFMSVISFAISRYRDDGKGGRVVAFALAATAASCAHLFGPNAALAAVFGAVSTAWLLSVRGGECAWPVSAAICLSAVTAADFFPSRFAQPVQGVGVYLALAAALAGTSALPLDPVFHRKDPRLAWLSPALALVLFAGIAFLVMQNAGLAAMVPLSFMVSLALAVICSWIMSESSERSASIRIVLCSVLWIALATAVLGLAKSAGLGVALLAAVAGMLFCGGRSALVTLGPFAALVIYRLFRLMNGGLSEQFDIAQHYAMIGFLAGAVLPILAQEWRRSADGVSPAPLMSSALVWVLILAAAPIPITVALSDRGVVAYLVGLGVAPVLEGLRGNRSALNLALSFGLAFGMATAYVWLQSAVELDRHGKIVWLSWFSVPLIAAAVFIAVLSAGRFRTREAEAAA